MLHKLILSDIAELISNKIIREMKWLDLYDSDNIIISEEEYKHYQKLNEIFYENHKGHIYHKCNNEKCKKAWNDKVYYVDELRKKYIPKTYTYLGFLGSVELMTEEEKNILKKEIINQLYDSDFCEYKLDNSIEWVEDPKNHSLSIKFYRDDSLNLY